MTKLELVYLIAGLGIAVRGTLDHGLTVPELGAAMFFIGLVPVNKADRKAMGSPAGFARKAFLTWLQKDPDPPKGSS